MKPSVDDLIAVRLARGMAPALADEESVRAMLDRVEQSLGREMREQIQAQMFLAICALASGIFAIDYETLMNASGSIEPGELDLPPLPFPRIIFEASDNSTWAMDAIGDDGVQVGIFDVQNVYVCERIQGEHWDGYFFVQPSGGRRMELPTGESEVEVVPLPFEIKVDQGLRFGSNEADGSVKWDEWSPRDGLYFRFAVEAVHLITARGVNLAALSPSRQVRRAAERKGMAYPAHVYWVDVDEGIQKTGPGDGTRTFHVRWIVRGHWRHLSDEKKTWVRPYIKGPAGAPWKGRPVYRVAA